MAIAKVIEIIASSPKGIEDAIRNGRHKGRGNRERNRRGLGKGHQNGH